MLFNVFNEQITTFENIPLLMLDMLHSNMLVVCTYHCRGVFEKGFLVWLL